MAFVCLSLKVTLLSNSSLTSFLSGDNIIYGFFPQKENYVQRLEYEFVVYLSLFSNTKDRVSSLLPPCPLCRSPWSSQRCLQL